MNITKVNNIWLSKQIINNVRMYIIFVLYDINSVHDLSGNINILLFIMSANNPYHL